MERDRRAEGDNSWLGAAAVGFGVLAGAGALIVAAVNCLNKEREEINKKIKYPDHRTKAEFINEEYDTCQRLAEVYLYTYPPQALPSAKRADSHHWAIVVEFEDCAYRTLEGYADASDGNLYGHYSKQRPVECHHKKKLGDMYLSPYDVWQCVMMNVLNGTPYNTTLNNCQDWALQAAQELGNDIFYALSKVARLSKGVCTLVGLCSALTSSLPVSSK